MAEWLVFRALNDGVMGRSPAGGKLQFGHKRHFIAVCTGCLNLSYTGLV